MLVLLPSSELKIGSKNKKEKDIMASKRLIFFYVVPLNLVLMIAVLNAPCGAAKEIKVGDAHGWQQPDLNHTYLYSLWASRMKFYVGDSLRFEYKNDSVLVVDKWAYYHCNSSSPISVFLDEITVIRLDKPGPMYFVSGYPGHCERGQRLLVDVVELHPKSPLLPPPPAASGTPEEMAPAPSPLSSSSGIQALGTTMLSSSMALVAAFTIA